MTTPLATVANSIIEFILSLLRDPAAVEELKKDPEAAFRNAKVDGLCADDVRAVAPIIYDRPDVAPRPGVTPNTPSNNDVVNEITRITNSWTTIDNRATIVDQSVNQNIWTEGGDVTQVFDQSAGVASGDGSIAAGDDVDIDNSVNGDDAPADDGDGEPTLTDLPGGGAGAGAGQGAGTGDSADEPSGADDLDELAADPAQTPQEQLADAATDAGVPQEAVGAVTDAVTDAAASTPEPVVYDAQPVEVDEAVWSDPADAAPVDDVVYPDELTEEQ